MSLDFSSVIFQYKSSYIVAVSFIGGLNRRIHGNPRSAASHWQTLSYKVLTYHTPRKCEGIKFTNFCVDKHQLQ